MKRKVPIKRNKPLVRRSYIKRTERIPFKRKECSPIRNYSEKTQKKMQFYYLIRPLYLNRFPLCTINLAECTGTATDIHHKEGRGPLLVVISKFASCCRSCHDKINENSNKAILDGHSISRNRKSTSSGIQKFNHKTILFLIDYRDIFEIKFLSVLNINKLGK